MQAFGTSTASVYCSPASAYMQTRRAVCSPASAYAHTRGAVCSTRRAYSQTRGAVCSPASAYAQTRGVVCSPASAYAQTRGVRSRIFRTPSLRFPLQAGGTEQAHCAVPLAKRGNRTPTRFPSRSAGTEPPP